MPKLDKTEVKEKKSNKSKKSEKDTKDTKTKKVSRVEEKKKKKDLEPEAGPKNKSIKVEQPEDFYAVDFDDTLDAIEKGYGLTAASFDPDEERQSTGLLMLDIMLGKGILPAWYTFAGAEQSAKSTTVTTIMTAGLNSNIPIIQMWDYEGSSQPDYLAQIMETNGITMPVDEVFGIRDPKSGKWVVKPRVRYYSENIAEKFFDSLARLQRSLPDKVKISGEWYYVYEDTKDNRKKMPQFDKAYWQKTKKLRTRAKDGTLQAMIFVDSYPAMLPEKQDVDDPNQAIAVQARMFADQLKRVKGRMKPKRIAVIGVNQLRAIPMAMYGPTENEPGGNALKLFSDVRIKCTSRALPAGYGKGQLEEEPSATGTGYDTYRYTHFRHIKNKLSQPNLEGWFRIWTADSEGIARGIDIVNDTYRYLVSTGQIIASEQPTATQRNKIVFEGDLNGGKKSKAISWLEFKILILGTKKQQANVYEKMAVKPRNIRKWCFKQISEKDGLEKYFAHKKAIKIGTATRAGDKDESTDDSDD